MFNRNAVMSLMLVSILTFLLITAGCSSDDPAAPGSNTPAGGSVEVPDFTTAIMDVVPAPYVNSGGKALSDWTGGDYPLLDKVIGNPESDEPMSLYRNLHEIDFMVGMIENIVGQATESYSATDTVASPEGEEFIVQVTYQAEAQHVAIPAGCQAAMGISELDVDHVIKIDVADIGINYQLGFGSNDSGQWALAWTHETMAPQNATNLYYATHDLATGEYQIRGAFWKTWPGDYGVDAQASWVYSIGTAGQDNQDFTYNMAWYSYGEIQEAGGELTSLLGCVNGSGNKDTEFALRYHQYTNNDWASIDTGYGPFEQLFGSGYSDQNDRWDPVGAGLIHQDEMYHRADLPTMIFDSPYDQD